MKRSLPWFTAAVLAASVRIAFAHGEHNLEAFVRLRGVAFLEVRFSHDRLAVNENMTISGKFRLMNSWPPEMAEPKLAVLSLLVPGPRFGVVERRLNGEFIQNAFHIERGKLYDFQLVLRARVPGRWHLHPLVNLSGTGSMVGPGKHVRIEDAGGPPSNQVQLTATGETIDLERFGWTRVVGWHTVFLALGLVWILYWIAGPLIVRYALLREGAEDLLITARDKRFGLAMLSVTVLIMAGGLWVTRATAPPTIPSQVQDTWEVPSIPLPSAVETSLEEFRYAPLTRTLTVRVKATNRGSDPVVLRKFSTSYLTFLADDALKAEAAPDAPIPAMAVEPKGPIAPGETKTLTLTMQDAIWQTDRFINYDQPQVTAAGLLVFARAGGANGEVLPSMVTSDREGPEIPWDRVVSVNEVFGSLRTDYQATGA